MPREGVISDQLTHENSATAKRAIVSRGLRLTSSLLIQVLWKFDLEWDESNKDELSGRRVWLMHEKGPLRQDVL